MNSTPEEDGWLEIAVMIHPVAHDAVGSFLFDLGCTGIVSENINGEALKCYLPCGRQPDPTTLQHQVESYLHQLPAFFPEVQSFQLNIQPMQEEKWALKWREHFRPQQITDRLSVYPAWESIPEDCSEHVIRMDPGPAFGTGMHPTTQMCLEAMERVSKGLESWTMLDAGTGSGILAIYGAMLGAERIVAVDIDLEALRWARQNAQINRVSGAIFFTNTPLANLTDMFTLIAANLSLEELPHLLHHLVRLLEKDGWLILSGILETQLPVTGDWLRKGSLHQVQTLVREEWLCLVLQKD